MHARIHPLDAHFCESRDCQDYTTDQANCSLKIRPNTLKICHHLMERISVFRGSACVWYNSSDHARETGMRAVPSPRPVWSSLAAMTALLVGVLLGTRIGSGPMCGMHTVRADDMALSMIDEAGCGWVVQLFSWSEIEPLPGEYFWEYPDAVVRACQYYGLNLVVRLDQPPDWALSPSIDGLPFDANAYASFVSQVAQRYQGRVRAYIIWNEPNLAREWGGQPPDAENYVQLLRRGYSAVKQTDPAALVVSAGLAPTNRVDKSALDDRIYLQAMYDAGAKESFDVLGAHPYGFAYPPDDPRHAHQGLNFARLLDLREIMLSNGDVHKPVWATEVGWTTSAADEQQSWLKVSKEQQASYLVGAFEKAKHDCPWLELVVVWNLSAGLQPDDEKWGYSIVDDEYNPHPAYVALAQMPKRRIPRVGISALAEERVVQILSPDVIIRLGDVDTFHPHWARIYGGHAPCRRWRGDFYLDEPGEDSWQLTMEIMQVEEQGNLVTINGQPLDPVAIPLRGKLDFASSWSIAFLRIPSDLLQPGRNTIEIAASPRLPLYQHPRAQFESLQFRNLRLLRLR